MYIYLSMHEYNFLSLFNVTYMYGFNDEKLVLDNQLVSSTETIYSALSIH